MLSKISYFLYKISPNFIKKNFTSESFVVYARNTQWITIWKLFTAVFSIITTMLVARILGPEQFGKLSYATSVVGIFSIFGSLGIGYIVYSDIVNNKENREEILGTTITLTLVTGSFAFICSLLYIIFLEGDSSLKMLMIILSISFFTLPFSYLHVDFLKDKESKFVAITQTIVSILSSSLKIITVFAFSSLPLFVIVVVFENVFAGIIYLYQIKYLKKRSIRFTVSKKRMADYFFMALPLTALTVFIEIYNRIDQILLKHMVNITSVGIYATAVRLTEIWYIVPNVLIASLFPALVHASKEKGSSEYRKRFLLFLLILIFVSGIISILTIATSKLLITFIYGPAFTEAANILAVYSLSLPGTFISLLLLQDIFLKGKKWLMVLFTLFTAATNISLCFLLIPSYGAIGAAVATSVSYNLSPLIYFFLNFIKNKRIV